MRKQTYQQQQQPIGCVHWIWMTMTTRNLVQCRFFLFIIFHSFLHSQFFNFILFFSTVLCLCAMWIENIIQYSHKQQRIDFRYFYSSLLFWLNEFIHGYSKAAYLMLRVPCELWIDQYKTKVFSFVFCSTKNSHLPSELHWFRLLVFVTFADQLAHTHEMFKTLEHKTRVKKERRKLFGEFNFCQRSFNGQFRLNTKKYAVESHSPWSRRRKMCAIVGKCINTRLH